MKLFRNLLNIILFLALAFPVSGQVTTTPASNACGCDGTISYSNASGQPISYELFSQSYQSIDAANAVNYNNANLCPGSYVLEITDAGQTSVQFFDIPINGQTIPTFSDMAVCDNELSFDLASALNNAPLVGVWTSPSGNPTSTVLNPMNAEEGVYWFEYTNNGCQISTLVNVSIYEAPNTGNQTTTLICDTWEPFNMLVYMQGAPDPGGQWFNAQGVPMDGFFHPAVMNSQMFTYLIDNVPGCATAYTTMFIQENSTPNPGLATSILACSNGVPFNLFAQLDGNPTAGGVWTNPNNQTVSATFTPGASIAGIYTYNINALTPCQDQEVNLTITLTNTDPSGLSEDLTICSNYPSFNMISALGGNPLPGGTWLTPQGDTIASTFTIANPGPGTYTYYYPNVGCAPQGANLTISVETLSNAGNDYFGAICESSNTLNLNTLRSGDSSNNGVWLNQSNIAINPVIPLNEAAEQTYLYFINGTACPDDQAAISIIVDQPPAPLFDQTIHLCSTQGQVDLFDYVGIDPNLFFTSTLGNSVSNLYDPAVDLESALIITSPSGNICPDATADLMIVIEEPISLTTLPINVCENTEVLNFDELVPSFSNIAGQWFTATGSPIANSIPLSIEDTHFYFLPTSLMACPIDTGFIQIFISTYQSSIEAPEMEICRHSALLDLNDLVPTDWSTNGNWEMGQVVLSATTIDPFTALSGEYIYTIDGQGSCPEAHYTLDLEFVNPPDYVLGDDLELCSNQNQIAIGNSNNAYNFNWQPTDYLDDPSASSPILSPDLEADQITVLEYTVQISNGVCTVTDTVQVTYYPIPTLPLEDLYSICFGEAIDIALPPFQTYQWSPASAFSNPTSNIQMLSPISSTTLSVNASNIWGCNSAHTFQVDVNPNPQFIVLANSRQACYEISDTLKAIGTGNYTYLWNDGINEYIGDSIQITLQEPGVYSIEVLATDSIGCMSTAELSENYEVFSHPTAIFNLERDVITTVDNTCQVINSTADAPFFEWTSDFGYSSEEYAPLIEFPNSDPRRFEICLTAINENNCRDSTCRSLTMINEYLFWAPNCFTPDGDQINDYFAIQMQGFELESYTLTIYDRWGIQVFESNQWQEPWIGDIQKGSHFAPSDTYTWVVKVKDKEQADYQTFKGHITLIR